MKTLKWVFGGGGPVYPPSKSKNKELKKLIKQYENTEDVLDVEEKIKWLDKDLSDMIHLYKWAKIREPKYLDYLFELEYHEGHPEYEYDRPHYHIEVNDFFPISQHDMAYLITDVLEFELNMYASHTGGHYHFFEDLETMDDTVRRLNEVFGVEAS